MCLIAPLESSRSSPKIMFRGAKASSLIYAHSSCFVWQCHGASTTASAHSTSDLKSVCSRTTITPCAFAPRVTGWCTPKMGSFIISVRRRLVSWLPTGEFGTLFHANRRRFEEKWGIAWEPYTDAERISSTSKLPSESEKVVQKTLPRNATVFAVSKGDGDLLNLDGRKAQHFPQNQ